MNYGGLFESWELGVAKKVIDGYRKKYKCLEREGFDDLCRNASSTGWMSATVMTPAGAPRKIPLWPKSSGTCSASLP